MRKFAMVMSAFALMVASAPLARADQYTISHLTFSGPFRLPGTTLPGGTYTFKRVKPGIIQVLSKDHSTLYGTFMTIPRLRSERTTNHEMVFAEAPAGEPPSIKAWYPFPEPAWFNVHHSVGYEFLYPKEPE